MHPRLIADPDPGSRQLGRRNQGRHRQVARGKINTQVTQWIAVGIRNLELLKGESWQAGMETDGCLAVNAITQTFVANAFDFQPVDV